MQFRFYQKYTSAILIFLLFLTQTVQVSFFDHTEAATEDYHDIVSIVVDTDTYSELKGDIKQYSQDIQTYLGSTRVSLFVVPKNTPPEAIAAQNEKLYYQGDGKDGVSSLVGTILIGNVPIPVVQKDGESFPSLYPYVDFDDKRFVYDPQIEKYTFSKNTNETSDVEIWHGVIDPALGRAWNGESDIQKIKGFLAKTHEFYQGKGKFAPSNIPPRVFYYDGYNESAAIGSRELYQYALFIKNAENFAYGRFTKYLLSDINDALKRYDKTSPDAIKTSDIPNFSELQKENPDLANISGGDTLSPDMLKTLSDVQSQNIINSFVKKFYEIINSKTLGDERLFVHNAGRYNNGADVSIDQGSVDVSLLDETAINTIKGANDALEAAINKTITDGNYARKIPIFDSYQNYQKTDRYDNTRETNKVYQNYFLGTKSTQITNPSQCTIARGSSQSDPSQMGRGILVEANTSFDINSISGQVDTLGKDTDELVKLHKSSNYSCFDPTTNQPKLNSYWKNNSFLNFSSSSTTPTDVLFGSLGVASFTGMSLPIASLGGMKESGRVTAPSINNCLDNSYQYALLQPYTFSYDIGYRHHGDDYTYSCNSSWPDEWNTSGAYGCQQRNTETPRFTCLTQQVPLAQNISTKFSDRLGDYGQSCVAGNLTLDGKLVKTANNTCIYSDDNNTYDNTVYQNLSYHTIPSLLTHISPTPEEINAASVNSITPNIPVDVIRSVDFLTPKGNIATFTYPDFFQAPGKTVAEMRTYLKNLSEGDWNKIISKENGTTLTQNESSANLILGAGILPSSPIDWNSLISDDVLVQILKAKNWMHPDVSKKYTDALTSDLSYSHTLGGDTTLDPPKVPGTRDGYEIAYLGLTSFQPTGNSTSDQNTSIQDYNQKMATLQGLNVSDTDISDNPSSTDPYPESTACGDPGGVDIFQWPGAIACWLKTLTPKISSGICGGNTIGMNPSSAPNAVIPDTISKDSQALKGYFDASKLLSSLPRTVMQKSDSISVSFDFQKDGAHIDLPENTNVRLDIISLADKAGKALSLDQANNFLQITPSVQPYGADKTSFLLTSAGQLGTVKLRGTLTTLLPDGTTYTSVSDDLIMRISDEYLDVFPTVQAVETSAIDTTLLEPVKLSVIPKNNQNTSSPSSALPYTLDIYDDISDTLLASDIQINSSTDYAIPVNYTKKIGLYRFELHDASGRFGETTLTVRSGPLAKSNFFPLSDTIVKSIDSYGAIDLLDAKDNLLTPELHTVEFEAKGGYLVDSDGKHVQKISMQSIESEIPLAFGSENAGKLTLSYSIDGVVTGSRQIDIVNTAKIKINRRGTPVVGGPAVPIFAEVVDENGQILSGFHSSISFSIPTLAGSFSTGTIAIENGKTADFSFLPGRVSGQHMLSMYVPGIGTIPDVPFSILPGSPFFIQSTLSDDTTSFTVEDRYGNKIPQDFVGTLQKDTDPSTSIHFTAGVYSMPRVSGYFTATVPEIANSNIAYTDTDGMHTISGIPSTPIFVPTPKQKFVFRPDYNARYTVFAGDSFLRESENILYDTTPGVSQSLAASTLMTSPYQTENYFSIFPGGGYSLGNASDILMKASAHLEQNTLILEASDSVSHTRIARVSYPTSGLLSSTCEESSTDSKDCLTIPSGGGIRFITYKNTQYQTQNDGSIMTFAQSGNIKVRYDKSAGLVLAAGVTLSPVSEDSSAGLVLAVTDGDKMIGRIFLSTDPKFGVQKSADIFVPSAAPILESAHPYLEKQVYSQVFNSQNAGYSIYTEPKKSELDETMIGPNFIDSLGSITDTSGVGWHDKNRMMLSYSAGDTVGEATKWFQTYTMVNLGDPVAHVDVGAVGTTQEGIDRSIGTELASGARGNIASVAHHDMNNDGYDDIIITYDDGFVELYLNLNGRFKKSQMIGYVPNISPDQLSFGDFTGDGFSDIVGLNNSGGLLLIDNSDRKFVQKPISLDDPNSSLPDHITQYKIYDMDGDKREDIVYLTEEGELGVLYGTATAGVFSKHVADSSLGVSLSADPETGGGVFHANTVPSTIPQSTDPKNDDSMIQSDVYYQKTLPSPSNDDSSTYSADQSIDTITNLAASSTPNTSSSNFVYSEYAPAFGLDIQKTYTNISASKVHAGDLIQVDIALKNTTTSTLSQIEYMDTIPKIFDVRDTTKYQLIIDDEATEQKFVPLTTSDFDADFVGMNIPAGKTLHIRYTLKALPATYGEMQVGNLQKGQVGEDAYGDIGFNASTTCGTSMMLWKSTSGRTFSKGSTDFSQPTVPSSIQNQIDQTNGEISAAQNLSNTSALLSSLTNDYNSMSQANGSVSAPFQANVQKNGQNYVASLDPSPEFTQKVTTMAQNIADGLSCGFGGGSCISSPMNWAPLAPGNDPVLFGFPVGDGLRVSEGIPTFSAMTGIPLYGPWGCISVPAVWPISPISLETTCSANLPGAGGYLGTFSPSNFFRVFVTPTLTLGMGTAICMGGPASLAGNVPPIGLSPFIQGGNCIVLTKPMNVCKGDGSSADGDVKSVSGLGTTTDAWNAGSCSIKADTSTDIATTNKKTTQDIIAYLQNPDTKKINDIYASLAKRGPRNLASGGPLLSMGDNSSGTKIDVDIDTTKPFDIHDIVKVKNTRIPAFPDFIMEWVARQTDEITNKLMTPPNIVIIPPRNFSQYGTSDKSFSNFSDAFSQKAYVDAWSNFQQKLGQAGNTDVASKLTNMTTSRSDLSVGYKKALDGFIQNHASTLNSAQGGLNQASAVFQFLGQLPFLKIQKTKVPINVPWILPQELDRYARTLDQYSNELDRTAKQWCVGKTPAECADIHANANVSALRSSIQKNLAMIETYKHFPDKLQKYLTWKQRYISEIMCNVTAFEQMIGGWYKDNGIRFRKWAEFYVLVKTVMESWQPVIDIFKKGDAQCSVCRNERGDLKYFKIKLISLLIPSLPIIQFPRWPDIVLDLSDVRLGLTIGVPEFNFHINPIRLPDLPLLNLPSLPSIGLSLPPLPTLPAIPNLPDLPDLPSFPTIQLPSLPPPPKLPKIFGSLSASLGLLQLFQKIRCYMEKTILIPEGQAGSVIADRTERQGTLNLDFLKVQLPQYALPSIREIRVSTHVNFEQRTDFITEFAKKAVSPINAFSADMQGSIQNSLDQVGKGFQDVGAGIQNGIDNSTKDLKNINLKVDANGKLIQSSLDQSSEDFDQKSFSGLIASLESQKDILLDTDDFTSHLLLEMQHAGEDTTVLKNSLQKSRIQSDEMTKGMEKNFHENMQLFYKYLDAESADTKEQEKMIERLKGNISSPLADADIPRAHFVSDETNLSDGALDNYNTAILKNQNTAQISSADDSSIHATEHLEGKMNRLLAENTLSNPTSSSSSDANYAPLYTGIYVLTPSGVQTKLFDYTDILDPSQKPQVFDADKDGDLDYLYILGGSVYIKYSSLHSPKKVIDTDISFFDLDPSQKPQAPNFFNETIASPGNIQTSFTPANPSDRQFRLEFFDRYTQWDLSYLNKGKPDLNTPKTTVDFFVEDPEDTQKSDEVEVTPVPEVLKSVDHPSGFILQGMSGVTLKSGIQFSLTAGRPLYTGNLPVSLTYKLSSGITKSLDMKKYQKYVFSEDISAAIVSGKAYILTQNNSDRLTYSDDFIGMPLLVGSHIINTDGGFSLYNPSLDRITDIPSNEEYRSVSLGVPSDNYQVNFPYQNGLYSARLTTLSLKNPDSIGAGITLLAPLASLDNSAPVVDIPSKIQIPVYQSQTFALKDIISDMSPTNISIDPDTSVDEDGNGVYDDDFVTSGTGVKISSGNIEFGPFDDLEIHMMQLKTEDAYGNQTFTPLEVDVFAPIPQIQNIDTNGILHGVIDPISALEPIHFFRIRSGSPLQQLFSSSTLTKNDGTFETGSVFVGTGVNLKSAGVSYLLDENNGLPSTNMHIAMSIVPATKDHPMIFTYQNDSGAPIMDQTISLPDNTPFVLNSQSTDVPKVPSVLVNSTDGYTVQSATLLDTSLPGGIYITDNSYNPIAIIKQDGQIYSLVSGVTLTAKKDGDYLSISILLNGKEITQVKYVIDFFYSINNH